MADQGDHPISRSSHKKTGQSGKRPSSSRRSQDTLGFPQLPPIVSIPVLHYQEEEIVAESTSTSTSTSSSAEEAAIVRSIPPTAGSGPSQQPPPTQQSLPSTSGRQQEQPDQRQQQESGYQSGHHQSGGQQSQTHIIQTASRLPIRPDGNGFDPHKKPVEAIANAIKENPGEGYPNWKKVPDHIRRLWFEAFQRQFQWSPADDGRIRKNFDLRGANRYRSLMASIRGAKRQPSWMGDEVYASLCQHWQSEAFHLKSVQAKKNRDINAGAPLHTGGSTPHRVVYRKLMDNEGNPPRVDTFYEATHRVRKGEKAGTWVSQQAQETYDEFTRRRDEVGSSQPSEGSSQPSQPPPNELIIFSDTVGGRKKGRIPGLGSLASTIGDAGSFIQPGSFGSSSSQYAESSRAATDSRVADLEAELRPLSTTRVPTLESELARMQEMVRQMSEQIRELSGGRFGGGDPQGGGGGRSEGDPQGGGGGRSEGDSGAL